MTDKVGIVLGQTPGFNETGTTGLKRWSGQVQEELLNNLQGERAVRIFTEMAMNDPVVSAMLFAIEMFVRQADWWFEPAGDTPADLEAAEFATSCLQDMSHTWQDFLSEALSMLPYGWSAFEIVYKLRSGMDTEPSSRYDDRRIGWRKFAVRAQDTLNEWIFDDAGGVQAMVQSAPPDFDRVEIPIQKLLLFRVGSRKNNPEGRSILRGAYRAWYFKKKIEELEGIGIERDLAGLPVAWVPLEWMRKDADPDQRAAFEEFKKIVTAVRRDEMEGLVLPLVWGPNNQKAVDFELMGRSGGGRQHDTDKIIQRWDQRIAMSILADFIIIGHEAQGSFALASSKTHTFSLAVDALLDTIVETVNRHAVTKLFDLNDFAIEEPPKLRHGDIETPELREVGNYILRLTTAGFDMRDPDTENYLRRIANLPPKRSDRPPPPEAGMDEPGDFVPRPQGGPEEGRETVQRAFAALARGDYSTVVDALHDLEQGYEDLELMYNRLAGNGRRLLTR